MHRVLTHQRPTRAKHPGFEVDFYRDELIKHQHCLRRQREYYSERAYASADQALSRLLSRLDQLCRSEDAEQVMSHLLRQLEAVTHLSAWSDPKRVN
jgi:hypothetical protein